MNKKIPSTFTISVFGETEKLSPTLSKARAKLFYKGRNRNGSFISDKVAEKLLASVPYSPIKGIYDTTTEDFLAHSPNSSDGKAYGLVPNPPNIAWEEHLDKDGVMRTYACVDAILWTGLYEEANKITGSSQSMELYPPSIKGDWVTYGNQEVFEFEDAAFVGLQVLGADHEPCFEGAGFFSQQDEQMKLLYSHYEQLKEFFEKEQNMDKEKNATVDGADEIVDFEDIEVDIDAETQDEVEPDAPETVEEDAPEAEAELEPEAEEAELEPEVEETEEEEEEGIPEEKVSDFSTKILELENANASLIVERDNFSARVIELEKELDELKEYKLSKELEEKQTVLNKYQAILSKESIDAFTDKLDSYSMEDLEKELAFVYLKENQNTVFSSKEEDSVVQKNFTTKTKSNLEDFLDQVSQNKED